MHKTNPKVELKLELTQVEGFGVGIFLRSVILEREVITTTYGPKGQVDGRGGEKETLTQKRNHYVVKMELIMGLLYTLL